MPFEELKARQAVMWGAGPYERVTSTVRDVHELVIERLVPRPGERFLDVATGTGAVARLAARAGADVTGLDLAPALIETARELAAAEGLSSRFDAGDAEALPYEDASFDVVASTFGVMFAPDHAAVARELARVCRPGGRLGLASWRPGPGVAELFAVTAAFQPPPPQDAGNPFDWGREEHVSALLGEAFELEFEDHVSTLSAESGEAVWEFFSTSFGPIKALRESLDAERDEDLHRMFADFHERFREDGEIRFRRPYLLALGHRR